MSKTNVVIFARVSSDSDRQDYARQITELQSVADNRGWVVIETIAEKISAPKITHS